MTITLEELSAPRPGPPSEQCTPCHAVRSEIRARAAAGDYEGVLAAQGLRELHEARAHESAGRSAAREPALKKPRVTDAGRTVRRTAKEVEAAQDAVHKARETVTRLYLAKVPLGTLAARYGVSHKWLRATLEVWEVPVRDRSEATRAARAAH